MENKNVTKKAKELRSLTKPFHKLGIAAKGAAKAIMKVSHHSNIDIPSTASAFILL